MNMLKKNLEVRNMEHGQDNGNTIKFFKIKNIKNIKKRDLILLIMLMKYKIEIKDIIL